MNEFEPRLYIVMRKDLWDMNPGKGMAQAAHAQADFDAYAENNYTNEEFRSAHLEWCEDRNFGVTLVLSATLAQMHELRTKLTHSDITVDPTYPYRNYYGEMFTSSEPTCMWAFVTTEEQKDLLKEYELHD